MPILSILRDLQKTKCECGHPLSAHTHGRCARYVPTDEWRNGTQIYASCGCRWEM